MYFVSLVVLVFVFVRLFVLSFVRLCVLSLRVVFVCCLVVLSLCAVFVYCPRVPLCNLRFSIYVVFVSISSRRCTTLLSFVCWCYRFARVEMFVGR